MKLYLSYFKLRIITFLQYRSAALAGLSTQFFWGLMLIFIYMALYENATNVGMNLTEIVCYVWLHQAFYSVLAVRSMDSEIVGSIKSGGIAYELIRPYNVYIWWYIKNLAKRIANLMLRILPVIIISVVLPKPYGISMPASLINFILFVISLMFGMLLVNAINTLIHTIGFYTYNDAGIASVIVSTMELLSGCYVPVALLPLFIQKGTYYLPFRLISDLPFRLYSNNIGVFEGLNSIILQIGWIIILLLVGNLIVKNALKKVFIQGG